MADADILSRPAALDQVQRFSQRLVDDAAMIEGQLSYLTGKTVLTTSSVQRFAESTPAIKLMGVLLQLRKAERVAALTADGGLTLEAAQRALRVVDQLEPLELVRGTLAGVLPSWFKPPSQKAPSLSLDPPARVGYLFWDDREAGPSLLSHLAPLRRQGLIDWQGLVGPQPNAPVQLNGIEILVVLITPGLLGSDQAMNVLAQALRPKPDQPLSVLPVLLSPTDLEGSQLASRYILPADGRPLLSRERPDEGWLEVAQGVRRIAKHIKPLRRFEPPDEASERSKAPAVCVLYHPSDRPLFDELALHLAPMQRAQQLSLWHPGLQLPGTDVHTELHAQVSRARVVVLLLSPAFVASESFEALATLAISRSHANQARVLAVPLKPFDPTGTPYETLKFEQTGGWIVGQALRDQGWAKIASELRKKL